MPFTSYADLIAASSASGQSELLAGWKRSNDVGTPAGQHWMSLWPCAGLPGAGSNSDGATSSQAGGVTFPNVSPAQRYLIGFAAVGHGSTANTFGWVMLYDRLVVKTGIALTSTGAKTVNSATITRYTSGVGVEVWLEVTTGITGSTPVVHLSKYTNQAGTANQVGASGAFPNALGGGVGGLVQVPLATTDTGVQSVEELTVDTAASTGVANVVLLRPLSYALAGMAVCGIEDQVLQPGGPPPLADGATLGLAWLPVANALRALSVHVATAWV